MSENKISDIIKKIMEEPDDLSSSITQKEVAEVLGYKLTTFRNKLSLDRFSVDDLMVIAEMCNYNLAFIPKGNDKEDFILSSENYLSDSEEKERLVSFRNNRLEKQGDTLDHILKNVPQKKQVIEVLQLDDDLKKLLFKRTSEDK